jgi:hypothetical protein
MMELLNWFKKPLNWWIGLALVINGTWLVRGVQGWESAVPIGGTSIAVGLLMVVVFGKVKAN